MKINKHLLEGGNIKLENTPNHSGKFEDGALDTIIIHYTAGPTANSAIRTLTNPRVKASAHLVIGRDGSITQLAPFNIIAWHAGPSSYRGRKGFNKYSIGIEIVNAGPLTKSGDSYRAWFGTAYPANEVIEAVHRNQTKPRFWHIYTPEQIEVTTNICRILIDEYNIKHILGHEEISPHQKIDPGPAFPLDKMRDQLLQGRRDANDGDILPERGRVMVSKLNIRSNPSLNGDKVAQPLEKGTVVRLLDKSGGWFKVATEIEGWVAAKYIGDD